MTIEGQLQWEYLVLYDSVLDKEIRIYAANGDPNGVISAPQGSIASDYPNSRIWVNSDGATAWTLSSGTASVNTDNTMRGDGSVGDPLLTRGIHRTGVLAGDTTIIDPDHQMLNWEMYTVDGDLVVDGDFIEVN